MTFFTTKEEIKKWLEKGKEKNASHVVIVCDEFSNEDYPVYVTHEQDVTEITKKYHDKNMQKVIEVYSLRKDFDEQLNKARCFNYD